MSMQQNLTMELCGYKLVKAAQTINKSVLTLAELEFSCAESKILIQGIPFEECQQYKIGQEYQFNFIQSDTATKNTYKVSSVQLDKFITMTQENTYKGLELAKNGITEVPVSINYHTDITLECKHTDFPVNLGDIISVEIEQLESNIVCNDWTLSSHLQSMISWIGRNIQTYLTLAQKEDFLTKWRKKFVFSELEKQEDIDFWYLFTRSLVKSVKLDNLNHIPQTLPDLLLLLQEAKHDLKLSESIEQELHANRSGLNKANEISSDAIKNFIDKILIKYNELQEIPNNTSAEKELSEDFNQ